MKLLLLNMMFTLKMLQLQQGTLLVGLVEVIAAIQDFITQEIACPTSYSNNNNLLFCSQPGMGNSATIILLMELVVNYS